MATPFALQITADKLTHGLRPSKRMPRDSDYLILCQGAVGREGALQGLDPLTTINTSAITDGFPYPQLFICTNLIVVCGKTNIYEWVNNALVLRLTVSAGNPWSLVDFFDYLYLSNGVVAVVRSATDKVFTVSATLPTAEAMLNVHGQVMLGGLTA